MCNSNPSNVLRFVRQHHISFRKLSNIHLCNIATPPGSSILFTPTLNKWGSDRAHIYIFFSMLFVLFGISVELEAISAEREAGYTRMGLVDCQSHGPYRLRIIHSHIHTSGQYRINEHNMVVAELLEEDGTQWKPNQAQGKYANSTQRRLERTSENHKPQYCEAQVQPIIPMRCIQYLPSDEKDKHMKWSFIYLWKGEIGSPFEQFRLLTDLFQ